MNWTCVLLALGFAVRGFAVRGFAVRGFAARKASGDAPPTKPPATNSAAKVGANAFYLPEAQIDELLRTAARLDMPVGELLKAVISMHAELGPETSWRMVWETLRRGDD